MNIATKFLLATCALAFLTGCGGKNVSESSDVDSTASEVNLSMQEELNRKAGDRVLFAFDKSALSHEAKETLCKQAEFLKANPAIMATIEGHTDNRGTSEYNMGLGERRAHSAKCFLRDQGVDAGRITTVSYGKEKPAVEGNNEAAWAQNRRAVTVVR